MMKLRIAIISGLLMALASAVFAVEPMRLEELLTKHLASIGSLEARRAANTRVVQGTAEYTVVTGGSGTIKGKTTMVSDGNNLRYIMRFNIIPTYIGDDFIFNGDKTRVAANTDGKRQTFSNFMYQRGDALLRDGLIAGTLSTAWPLLDPKLRSAKLSYQGLKKMDGRELYEVKYQSSKEKADLQISLYFEPVTFRHVLTVATATLPTKLIDKVMPDPTDVQGRGSVGEFYGASGAVAQSQQQKVYFRLEQRFEDFRRVNGLILPMQTRMRFSAEGFLSQVVTYNCKYEAVQSNIGLDPKNFEIR